MPVPILCGVGVGFGDLSFVSSAHQGFFQVREMIGFELTVGR